MVTTGVQVCYSKVSVFARHWPKLLLSAAITAALLYTLKRSGLSLWPPKEAFAHVKWWTIVPYLGTLIATHVLRAMRWRYLLHSFSEVTMKTIFTSSWVGFAAILIFPFRLGEVVRPYMMSSRGGVSLARATGSVVGERVADGLYLTAVLAVALFFVPNTNPNDMRIPGLPVTVADVHHASIVMFLVFAAAFSLIALYRFARTFAIRLTSAVIGVVSRGLAEKISTTAGRLADGLEFLARPKDALPFLLETTAYWLSNALGLWLLGWGCGVVHADGSSIMFGEACAIMGVLCVAILIPGPPLLLGTFQTGVIAGLGLYFPEAIIRGPGVAYASLMFAVQFVWVLGAGGVSLLVAGPKVATAAADAIEIA